MSKLIISLATLGSGGAERVLSILSTPFADNFDEVQIVLWKGGRAYYKVDPRITVVSLPELTGNNGRLRQIMMFRRYVKRESPDLVLSMLASFNMLVLFATLGLKIKIVAAERNDPMYLAGGAAVRIIRNILYKRTIGILAQTEYAKSCFNGVLNRKTTVIYNPVTMEKSQVGLGLRATKKKLITSIGSLDPKKDQTVMIDAFKIFHKTHPDYKLIIFGEGQLRRQLESYIERQGLKEIVLLPGTSKKVWDEISISEFFLLSSTHEGMSNAMIEALCLGLPVVTTKVAGATDLIEEGKSGFIVDIKDSESMADRMCQLADNPELRKLIGQEATKVYDMLRADKICQQWVDYLKMMATK